MKNQFVLPSTLLNQVGLAAQDLEISAEEFVTQAVAEKLARHQHESWLKSQIQPCIKNDTDNIGANNKAK